MKPVRSCANVPLQFDCTYLLLKMRLFVFIALITIQSTNCSKDTANPITGCFVDINDDLTQAHPLILNVTTKKFVNPGLDGKLTFNAGEKVLLSCTGANNAIVPLRKQEGEVECHSGDTFVSDSIAKPFKELKCSKIPQSKARKSGKRCSGKYTEIEIGFDLSTGFSPFLTTCFDETTKNSLYSNFTMSGRIRNQQVDVQRPTDFEEGGFYPDLQPSPTVLYTRKQERQTFAQILKSEDLANMFVKLTDDYFLARGHLAAKTDFLYASQQRATFYYINVAPQWQVFNGGNWEILERDVRSYVNSTNQDHVVFTGVWETSQLLNVYNQPVDLSLYVDNKGNNQLYVPDLFWKILYDPVTKTGVAFVGHNNPYAKYVFERPVCRSICDRLSMKLNWDASNVTTGYSYCCEYKELKKVVTYLPDIEVQGLLSSAVRVFFHVQLFLWLGLFILH